MTVVPVLEHRRGRLSLERPAVMGIVNVTPDSFSDGGRYEDRERAVAHALQLAEEGAALLDIGGESTRPGARSVPVGEELERVIPVVEMLRARTDVVVSVDTTKAAVAREALRAGADIVNDISGLSFDERMAATIAEAGAGCILMHTPGRPGEMMALARYDDVLGTVAGRLGAARAEALAAGIAAEAIALDPGFGFGKLPHDNWRILHGLGAIVSLGSPVLVGVSRKRMLREVLGLAGLEVDEGALDMATAAVCGLAWGSGARIFRVHDVRAARVALACAEALSAAADSLA